MRSTCTACGAHVHLVGWAVGLRGAWPYCVEAVQSPCSGAAASVMAVLLATVGEAATVAAVAAAAMLVV